MAIRRIRYEEIDFNAASIETSNAQARQENITANIDELAQSIEMQGLFSPILLIDLGNGKYELIAGQRRMLAYRTLSGDNSGKFEKNTRVHI